MRAATPAIVLCIATLARAVTPEVPATHVELPSVGVAFDAPAGWTRRPEQAESQLARFAHVVNGKLVGLVIVDVSLHRANALKAFADQVAAKANGKVIVDASPMPDDAIELKLPPQDPLAANLAAIRAMHDDALLVTSMADDDASAAATLRSVLASVVLGDPKPASETLGAPGVPAPLFDSQVTLTLPEPFRPGAKARNGTQLFFGVHDWTTGKDDCTLIVQQMPNPKGLPIDEIARTSTAALTAKFKLAQPMTATHVNAAPATSVSSSFDVSEGKPSTQRIAWARLDGTHYAMLIFGVTAADAAGRERYVALAESVAKGLKIGKPVAASKP